MRDSKKATPNTSRAARMTQPEPGIGRKKATSTAISDQPITWFSDTRESEPPELVLRGGGWREGFSKAGADRSAGRLRMLRGFSGKSSIFLRISSISRSMRSATRTTPSVVCQLYAVSIAKNQQAMCNETVRARTRRRIA